MLAASQRKDKAMGIDRTDQIGLSPMQADEFCVFPGYFQFGGKISGRGDPRYQRDVITVQRLYKLLSSAVKTSIAAHDRRKRAEFRHGIHVRFDLLRQNSAKDRLAITGDCADHAFCTANGIARLKNAARLQRQQRRIPDPDADNINLSPGDFNRFAEFAKRFRKKKGPRSGLAGQ